MINLLLQRLFFYALTAGLAVFVLSGTSFAANGPNENDEDMEILTRGPIHEAFADVSVDETPTGPVVSRPVPEPINELPPEIRPEGNQIEWIPGYWSWDEDQNDFIWVSGVWRDIPPDRQWVAGHWQAVDGGNRYISGYWIDTNRTPAVYLPPPPQPLQAGPSSPATAPGYVWMDGNWIWSQNGYAWQSGYWYEPRPDMVWVPAHYVWTPRGYVFVMGYWDYYPARRGVMFAPLYYPRPIYRHHGYFYRPRVVLDTNDVFLSLFVRRGHRHYYFGDYHDLRYEKRGFRPWYSKNATRYGYDPFYKNYRSHRMREDRQWESNYRRQFEHRRGQMNTRSSNSFEQTRGRQVNQPRNQTSQRIGKMFSDTIDNSKGGQNKQFIPGQQDRRQESRSQNRVYTTLPTEHKKFNSPRTQGQGRQPSNIGKPQKTNSLFVPGQSKEQRQEYADQQNQRFQEQNRNNTEATGQRLWHKRQNQQGYSK